MTIGTGPTGKFPQGKLSPDDDGELIVAITEWHEQVRVEFGKPVEWVAMPPDLAFQIANRMIAMAVHIKGKAGEEPPPRPHPSEPFKKG